MLSDLQLALEPEVTYRRLVAEAAGPSWRRVAARLVLVALTFAVIVPIMATHAVTIGLVLVSAAAWCFVPLVQAAMAFVAIAPARGRSVNLARAFELWFAGHLPYTAWLLLLPIVVRISQRLHFDLVIATLAGAIIWASIVEAAYCRVVLNASPSAARVRVTAHQALMLTLVGAGVLWAAGGVAATFSSLARMAAQVLG